MVIKLRKALRRLGPNPFRRNKRSMRSTFNSFAMSTHDTIQNRAKHLMSYFCEMANQKILFKNKTSALFGRVDLIYRSFKKRKMVHKNKMEHLKFLFERERQIMLLLC